jgi:uncharacterized membrane protein
MFCQYCGATLAPDSPFCTSCGRQQPAVATNVPQPFVTPSGVKVDTGRWLSDAWNLVLSEWAMFALVTLLFLVVGSAVPIILQGPMAVGIHIVCVRKIKGGRVDVNDLFKGFNYFVPSLVAVLLVSIFSAIGFLLCIIPGIVVIAMYQFVYLFIADKKMDFWPAMEASHAIVKQDYFGFTLFIVAAGLINLLGVLACAVGLLVTIPMTYMAITLAYRDLVGFEPAGEM